MSDRNGSDRDAGPAGEAETTGDASREARPEKITGGEVRTEDIAPEGMPLGAEMGEARLGGIAGLGTLQIVRDRNGKVLHLEGTWRPHDEGTDVSRLHDDVEAGRALRYEGKLHDPAEPERNRCEVDVKVTSRSDYTYDARDEDDGHTRPLFNFEPVDPTGFVR